MRKRKPTNYQIEVNGEPLITQIPKRTLDSLVFSLELAVYDMLEQEKSENQRKEEEKMLL
jgi:hypothetical protein